MAFEAHGAGQTRWHFHSQHHQQLPQQIMYVYSLHRTPSYFWENYSKASMSQMAGSSMISVVRTLAVLTRKPWPGPTLGREEGILFISTLEE